MQPPVRSMREAALRSAPSPRSCGERVGAASANMVRVGIAESPHPDALCASTSPRKRGEVKRTAWPAEHHPSRGVRCRNSVCTPQVALRTLITRVPGLRPMRTSDTSMPASIKRDRAASMSPTRQLNPQSLS